MVTLRPARSSDLDALYAISLATGAAGGDAAGLYEDGALLGHIYSAPYAQLEPGLALVLEDAEGVAAFAVGTLDTAAWEARLERDWWPALRRQQPDPAGAAGDLTADQRRWAMIHHPERTPVAVARDYPAHMHLNLLPRLQRQGLGSKLAEAWLARAFAHGARAIHVGVNHLNDRALRFWARTDFRPLDTENGSRTVWMGRALPSAD